MGEYEPDDSRDVTQRNGPEPGGIKRTGPRENGARAVSEAERDKKKDDSKDPNKGEAMPGQQQRQRQSQGQSQTQSGGQSQSQSQSSGAMHPRQSDDSPLAGDQKQAIDNPVGTAEPDYDQYELNQPSNLARHGVRRPEAADAGSGGAIENTAPAQAASGERQDQPRDDPRRGQQAAAHGDAQAAYGNSRSADGARESDAADALDGEADADRAFYEGSSG